MKCILAYVSSLVFICVLRHHYVSGDVIEMGTILSDGDSLTDAVTTEASNGADKNGTGSNCPQFFSNETGQDITWPKTTFGSSVRIVKEKSICGAEAVRVCQDGGEWGQVYLEPERCPSDVVLNFFVYIGYSVSLLACIVAFIIFLLTRSSLRTIGHYQYHIHWNLITSFILYHVVFLVAFFTSQQNLLRDSPIMMNIISALLVYLVVANFFWMLVEGGVLLVLVATPFPGEQRGRAFVKWFILGWGVPAVLVVSWIIAAHVSTPADRTFMLQIGNGAIENYICIVGPIFLALLINCIVVIVVMRILWLKLQADDVRTGISESTKKSWRTAKSTFVLILLLGVYYPLPMILFVFEPPYKLMYVVSFFGTMVSSVQGLAVSTFYVFCNAEVCDQVRRALKNRHRQWRYKSSMKYSVRLSSRSSSKSATPRHSKSHSSSDSCGKRPVKDGDEIETTLSSDVNSNVNQSQQREMCVIMENQVPLAAGESYGSIRGYVRLSTNEPEDV
ncbi:corticotropin-releasing factor receptor 1-like isoform X1 [Asterias rubens]|uniref:corticotropin-releasing factor receptor 1-like isoform X1 n=1 Tax=Asterias rubens TaxID=7604 RepID=UPI00145547F0|nr:corticotropin-releasing factor receptor 1-like isoform X1 [Asterias rubens]